MSMVNQTMLEMFVKQVGVNAKDGHPVVVLKEKRGDREMPIWVGPLECRAIAQALTIVATDRPLTHDLTADIILSMGGRITGVDICRIADSTFYAKLWVSVKGKDEIVVDCRPSDGIALALRHGARIWVAAEVVEQAGYKESEPAKDDTEEFKKFVQDLKASDFNALQGKKKRKADGNSQSKSADIPSTPETPPSKDAKPDDEKLD